MIVRRGFVLRGFGPTSDNDCCQIYSQMPKFSSLCSTKLKRSSDSWFISERPILGVFGYMMLPLMMTYWFLTNIPYGIVLDRLSLDKNITVVLMFFSLIDGDHKAPLYYVRRFRICARAVSVIAALANAPVTKDEYSNNEKSIFPTRTYLDLPDRCLCCSNQKMAPSLNPQTVAFS